MTYYIYGGVMFVIFGNRIYCYNCIYYENNYDIL